MDPDRVPARILLRHVQVILLAIGLALGVGALLFVRHQASYTAAARLSIATTTPKSAAEADALTSQARALATSRSVLTEAAAMAHVSRDPGRLASKVSLQGLGTSPLATLSITDSDPQAATALTAATAQLVVDKINEAAMGGLPTVFEQIDRQLDVLTKQRAAVAAQLVGMPPGAQQLQLLSRQAGLDQELQDLASERSRLTIAASAGSRAVVIDVPHGAAPKDGTHLLSDLTLAGLVGLVAGIAAAGVLEILRPVVADAKRLSQLASSPVLGDLRIHDETFDHQQILHMRRVLMLAASSARIAKVVLLGPVDEGMLDQLAGHLDGERLPAPLPSVAAVTPATAGAALEAAAGPSRELRVRTLATLDGSSPEPVAAVVVAYAGGPRKQLTSVDDFVRAAGWPVIGVATVHRPSWSSRAGDAWRRRRNADASHRRPW